MLELKKLHETFLIHQAFVAAATAAAAAMNNSNNSSVGNPTTPTVAGHHSSIEVASSTFSSSSPSSHSPLSNTSSSSNKNSAPTRHHHDPDGDGGGGGDDDDNDELSTMSSKRMKLEINAPATNNNNLKSGIALIESDSEDIDCGIGDDEVAYDDEQIVDDDDEQSFVQRGKRKFNQDEFSTSARKSYNNRFVSNTIKLITILKNIKSCTIA